MPLLQLAPGKTARSGANSSVYKQASMSIVAQTSSRTPHCSPYHLVVTSTRRRGGCLSGFGAASSHDLCTLVLRSWPPHTLLMICRTYGRRTSCTGRWAASWRWGCRSRTSPPPTASCSGRCRGRTTPPRARRCVAWQCVLMISISSLSVPLQRVQQMYVMQLFHRHQRGNRGLACGFIASQPRRQVLV